MTQHKTYLELIRDGVLSENPIFRLALSMCPAVGVTGTIKNGLLLGTAVLFVQALSSVTVALFKNLIHPRIRIPTYVIIIALWVSATDMILAAYVPEIYKQVALYVKLIVVFAIIISRLELFACKNPVLPSFFDAVGMGLGFMFGLVIIGFVRELLGAGTVMGYDLIGFRPFLFFSLPTAGFFVIGFLMAAFNKIEALYITKKRAHKK
ncbi:MAG: electron transport complex subunit RsxE [Pseudomonadota bacterium]